MSALINHSPIPSVISLLIPLITALTPIIYILFVSTTFNKYENLVSEILYLKIGSYIITNSSLTIWIYNQFFMF